MPRLLIVHHTPSPSLEKMFDAVRAGATDESIEGVEVVHRAALSATASDVLAADGYVLGTPVNIGYMSGALKHFFDTIYYPCREDTQRRPFGVFVHGDNDTTGAVTSIDKITKGLGWRQAQEPVSVVGPPQREDLDACWELGAALSAGLSVD